jgi:hypothetical protein
VEDLKRWLSLAERIAGAGTARSRLHRTTA